MKKKIFFVITLCVPLIALEAPFRLMPVSDPPLSLTVNEKEPVARFQSNVDYRWSKGWNFNIVTRKHTNNSGYINDYDYFRSSADPLMVIIGDSYVEAHQVSNDKTMFGILGEQVKDSGRVYSLGLSGAPLSQYLVFAEYARDELSPDSIVFVVVGNDFDESLRKYMSAPRFHHFAEKDGRYIVERVDYEIGWWRKIFRKSAFVRYIIWNLEIKPLIERARMKSEGMSGQFIGNVPRDVSNERLNDSKIAVDEFFRQLPQKAGLDTNKILFVLDGMRPSLYSDDEVMEAENSYYGQMRSYFSSAARELGYQVKDMQPVFIGRHRFDGSTFEVPNDGHWNELGHELVASEIASSHVYKATFNGP